MDVCVYVYQRTTGGSQSFPFKMWGSGDQIQIQIRCQTQHQVTPSCWATQYVKYSILVSFETGSYYAFLAELKSVKQTRLAQNSERDLPTFASRALELKVCAPTPGHLKRSIVKRKERKKKKKKNKNTSNQVWWFILVILALKMPRQEDCPPSFRPYWATW